MMKIINSTGLAMRKHLQSTYTNIASIKAL